MILLLEPAARDKGIEVGVDYDLFLPTQYVGDPGRLRQVMTNLLGDIWQQGEPAWQVVLNEANAHLHLYGKHEARPGRKMGHINCTADDLEQALATTATIRKALSI